MRVEDLREASEVINDAQLESLLSKRYGNGANAFWLFGSTEKYPAMSILVKGDLATLHYFPRARHPGYRSIGLAAELGLDPEGMSVFYANEGEEQEIVNDSIVPFPHALAAAREFLASGRLPEALEWFEL